MIIDSHQHFWKYNPVRDQWIDESMQMIRRDFLPEDLEIVLNKHRIDGCIAVQADQSEEETLFLLQLAEQYSFIKGVVGWVDMCSKTIVQDLRRFSTYHAFKGVRHIVQAEQDGFMLKNTFQHGIAALEPFNVTYDVLIFPHQLDDTITLVKKFPNQKFIIDHLAKPLIKSKEITLWKQKIKELATHPNVYCKLSGMVTEADWQQWTIEDIVPYMDVVFNAFGTSRVVFGSDWPVCLLAASYEKVLHIVETYIKQFSVKERRMIMGENACSFYNL